MSHTALRKNCNFLFNKLKTESSIRNGSFERNLKHFSQISNLAVEGHDSPVTSENQYEAIREVMEPFGHLSYEEQLEKKQSWSHQIRETIIERFKTLKFKGNVNGCTVEKISPSPVIEKYRNKDEFSIHYGVDGNPKTVGFFIGQLAKSNIVCVPATHLSIIKDEHKALAEVYQNFIRSSNLPVCYSLDDGGCFRTFTVRSNSAGETMAIAVSHPAERNPFDIEKEREDLLNFFQKSGVMPTSLFHQTCKSFRCTNEQSPFKLLYGEPYLFENLLDLQFRISPDAFFQINVEGAEVLYTEIVRLAKLKPFTTLLDLCCGTGTISLVASRKVRGCVGVESVKDAVADARINALDNNIFNCDFVHGTVEKKLFYALRDLDMASHVVAVVNPGRGGLHEKAMETILKCDLISQLIYVSCAADNPVAMRNFIQLTNQPRKATHKPFNLSKIKPVDLFPKTRHCELLLVFDR
ncbi:unnamed protein product [Bemisia tabaci]|uniref:tRNA (uracil(54)-C(5))-methyltransferase n=1 Tax=Bemisia tabaci TaxID=7038 RepID=A0A9P0AAX1_BEMTA|nr:unnamed protein product [Bemisia tabaci]